MYSESYEESENESEGEGSDVDEDNCTSEKTLNERMGEAHRYLADPDEVNMRLIPDGMCLSRCLFTKTPRNVPAVPKEPFTDVAQNRKN